MGTHQGYLPEGAQDCRGQTAHGRESGELALRENVLVTLKVLLIKQDPAGEGEGVGDMSGWVFEPALSSACPGPLRYSRAEAELIMTPRSRGSQG